MTRSKTRRIAYVALYAALCMVLQWVAQFIPFLQMPQGGSIELGYAALFIASFHLGPLYGMVVGLIWWLIGLICGLNNWFLNVPQYALDYILPVIVCGLSAGYPRFGLKGYKSVIPGVVLGMALKYLCNLLSGVYYWPPEGGAAGSKEAWIYSLGYNAWYNLATLAVCVILVPLLAKRIGIPGRKEKEKISA